MTRIRIEWRESERPWTHRSIEGDWPSVPRVGEFVQVNDETGEGHTVQTVMWDSRGEAVIRLRFTPVEEARP